MTEPSLATTVAGVRDRMSRFQTPMGADRAREFCPRPSDVLIATYPKCGTTLLQQIVHGLRTGGDMSFGEITDVVPWLEMAYDLGVDPNAEQVATPRAFKTHWNGIDTPRDAKSIYVSRDPFAMLVSFYHFLEGWFFEPGSIDLESFALDYLLEGTRSGGYWDHLVSWWPRRNDVNTLFLCYEDVVADLEHEVRRVSEFIGVATDEATIEIATRQARIGFMRMYPACWDDHVLRACRNAACGVPPDAGGTKVRPRDQRYDTAPSEAVVLAWNAVWRDVVQPVTGSASYAELRHSLASGR